MKLEDCALSLETRMDLGWLVEYLEARRLQNLAMALWGGGREQS
jgi:hypothetical protein